MTNNTPLTRQISDKQPQSGRGMTEMLGVIVIIGVLSIGGILGYRYMMDKFEANEIVNELNLRASIAAQQLDKDITAPLSTEMGNTLKTGYSIALELDAQSPDFFYMYIGEDDKKISSNVCKQIVRMGWKQPTAIYANDSIYQNDTSICDSSIDVMTFVFDKRFAQYEAGEFCSHDADCTTFGKLCHQCLNNTCVNPRGDYMGSDGSCIENNPCSLPATWDNETSMCVCPSPTIWSDAAKACLCPNPDEMYDEMLGICKPNTCAVAGEILSYYQQGSVLKEKCCPLGQNASYVDQDNKTYAKGYCCPAGNQVVRAKDGGQRQAGDSYCVNTICPAGQSLISYRRQYTDIPICCPIGTNGAGAAISGDKEYPSGACCPSSYQSKTGNYQSYCEPIDASSCHEDKPKLLTYRISAHGGHADGNYYSDTVQICCPETSTAGASYVNINLRTFAGHCCAEGYEQGTANGGTSCKLASCPEGQEIRTYRSSYGDLTTCCPKDVTHAARVRYGGLYDPAFPNCCAPWETSVNNGGYSFCSHTEESCTQDQHLVPFVASGQQGQMCCPKTTFGAWACLANYGCCAAGEEALGSNCTSCVLRECPIGQERKVMHEGSTFMNEKCCPIESPGAALCDSSGNCCNYDNNNGLLKNPKGYCCGQGEESIQNGRWSWCVPTTCPIGQHKLSFRFDANGTVIGQKCCPTSSRVAARYDWKNASHQGGTCCNEDEIVINSGTTPDKCEKCPAGTVPDNQGLNCI